MPSAVGLQACGRRARRALRVFALVYLIHRGEVLEHSATSAVAGGAETSEEFHI